MINDTEKGFHLSTTCRKPLIDRLRRAVKSSKTDMCNISNYWFDLNNSDVMRSDPNTNVLAVFNNETNTDKIKQCIFNIISESIIYRERIKLNYVTNELEMFIKDNITSTNTDIYREYKILIVNDRFSGRYTISSSGIGSQYEIHDNSMFILFKILNDKCKHELFCLRIDGVPNVTIIEKVINVVSGGKHKVLCILTNNFSETYALRERRLSSKFGVKSYRIDNMTIDDIIEIGNILKENGMCIKQISKIVNAYMRELFTRSIKYKDTILADIYNADNK